MRQDTVKIDAVFTALESAGELAFHKYVRCVECNGVGVIALRPAPSSRTSAFSPSTPGIEARVDFCPSCKGLGRIEGDQLVDPESAPEQANATETEA